MTTWWCLLVSGAAGLAAALLAHRSYVAPTARQVLCTSALLTLQHLPASCLEGFTAGQWQQSRVQQLRLRSAASTLCWCFGGTAVDLLYSHCHTVVFWLCWLCC